jgi:nicastrin
MFQPMRVPMFSCRDAKASELILSKALDNHARQFAYPQWGALLNAHMDAGVNAETCLRRGFCQPIGGESVWAARGPLVLPDAPDPVVDGDNSTSESAASRKRSKRPIVLLSAAIDSQSLFQDEAVGARSEMAALVIALATLDALVSSNVSDDVWNAAPRQPLFAFFTGEAWNQMGSKQFFRDVAQFECKQSNPDYPGTCMEPYVTSRDFQDIALSNVAFMMHLSADLGVTSEQQVFWHVGNVSDTPLGALVRAELALSTTVRSPSPSVTTLPPSALTSARRHRAALPGVVLGGFDDRFNSRYHSRLDDARGATTKWLCPTALAVARSFVSALFANDTSAAPLRNNSVIEAVQVNCTLVDALWHCLVEDALCDLVRTTLQYRARADATDPRPTHYVGVHSKGNGVRGHWAPFINAFAAWRFKQRTGKECGGDGESSCAAAEQCVMSACVYANVHYHDALSEGLMYSAADNEYVVLPSGDIWVESNWANNVGLRLFKRSGEGASIALLVFGIALFAASVAALVVGKKKVSKSFKLM